MLEVDTTAGDWDWTCSVRLCKGSDNDDFELRHLNMFFRYWQARRPTTKAHQTLLVKGMKKMQLTSWMRCWHWRKMWQTLSESEKCIRKELEKSQYIEILIPAISTHCFWMTEKTLTFVREGSWFKIEIYPEVYIRCRDGLSRLGWDEHLQSSMSQSRCRLNWDGLSLCLPMFNNFKDILLPPLRAFRI